MRKTNFGISNLICPCCGNAFPIPRKRNKQREKDHIKTIWCPFCKKLQNFVEQGIYK